MKIIVEVYEHERGWDMRLDHIMSFEMGDLGMRHARKYRDYVNSQNNLDVVPDVYYRAHDPRVVD